MTLELGFTEGLYLRHWKTKMTLDFGFSPYYFYQNCYLLWVIVLYLVSEGLTEIKWNLRNKFVDIVNSKTTSTTLNLLNKNKTLGNIKVDHNFLLYSGVCIVITSCRNNLTLHFVPLKVTDGNEPYSCPSVSTGRVFVKYNYFLL